MNFNLITITLTTGNELAKIIAMGLVSALFLLLVQLYRKLKYRNSDTGKFERKIKKKNDFLRDLPQDKNTSDYVNKDLIQRKRKELTLEIENDVLDYQLKNNQEFQELVKLKKQGILEEKSFNDAVRKLKNHLKDKPSKNATIIELDDGVKLKIKKYYSQRLVGSELLSHLDKYNQKLVQSNDLHLYITQNKIRNVYKEKTYDNGFVFAQQKATLSYGDLLIKPSNYKSNELVIIQGFIAVDINQNKVRNVYWIRKAKTSFKGNLVQIYQRSRNQKQRNDLVFINSKKAKNGIHFIDIYGSLSIIRTKNGRIR